MIQKLLNSLKGFKISNKLRLSSFFSRLFKQEPKQVKTYKIYTYKTELEIVLRNNQVVCTDYVNSPDFDYSVNDEYADNYNPVKEYIDNSFENGVLHIFDKSNKRFTGIVTVDIIRILYKKPILTIEIREL